MDARNTAWRGFREANSDAIALRRWRSQLSIALFGCALSFPAVGQFGVYNLRTEPTIPVAGRPFSIVVDSNICEHFIQGDPYGEGRSYDDVSVDTGVIRARIGYYPLVLCLNTPETFRLPVQALPAGTYRIDLIGRFLFTTDDNLLRSDEVTIAGAVASLPREIPASGTWGNGFMIVGLLFAGTLLARSPEERK